jgi:hypothetical protein
LRTMCRLRSVVWPRVSVQCSAVQWPVAALSPCQSNERSDNTALYNTAQLCTALHNTAQLCTALHCTALHFTALHCTVMYSTALHSNALHCTARHCTALQCSVYCRVSTAGSWRVQRALPAGGLPTTHQCSAVQCSAVQCSAVQCSAVWEVCSRKRPEWRLEPRGIP